MEVFCMFGLLPNIGPWELLIVLGLVLIIFGPGKLPQVGKSIGASLREFRKATDSKEESVSSEDRP
jgi:sec-independent protein translocase protein TatA